VIHQDIVPAAVISFIITVAFIFVFRPLAFAINLVDRPGGRKRHVGDVPIVGGIAMFLGVLGGLAIVGGANDVALGIVFAFFLLVPVGIIDDASDVPPVVRILVQVAAVLIMVYSADLMIYSLGNPFGFGEILLGPFAMVGTLMVSLTVINAYNLIDGVDGLAGILALITLIGVAAVGGLVAPLTFLALIVAGAVVGYLVFNFPVLANRSLRTFMGDAGSTVLGFTIFWVTLGISQGEAAVITPVAGLWFASIPVYDALTCFVRRIRAGKSPFTPGRDHFHHTLRRGHLSMRRKLGILGGLQAIYAFVGVTGSLAGIPDVVLFAAWSVLGLTQYQVIKTIAIRHRLGTIRNCQARALSSQ